HIEEAGIHSGDSSCALPPMTLGPEDIDNVRRSTRALAKGIGVQGLMNVQYALKDDTLYVCDGEEVYLAGVMEAYRGGRHSLR
ncbi:hypothetical protein HT105_23600, partial [Bacteroides fragilis]|nr:hypothetical protein [Bacteroides fragilis]